MTNSQPNLVELAKKGDTRAIAALMNRSLQPKDITAKVVLRNGCLQVMLESLQIPDQKASTVFLKRVLHRLDSEVIERVKVYGRKIGDEVPAWDGDFELIATKLEGLENPIVNHSSSEAEGRFQKGQTSSVSQVRASSNKPLLVSNDSPISNDLPVAISIVLGMLGILTLKANFFVGAFILAIAFGIYYAWYTTDGKALAEAKRLKTEQEKLAIHEAEGALDVKMKLFFQSPQDAILQEELLNFIMFLPISLFKNRMRSTILPFMAATALNNEVRTKLFNRICECVQSVSLSGNVVSQEIYELALHILQQHPGQIGLKLFALEVGRWHFGKSRGGRVTIYDEQAIQNDISVRSK